MKILININSSLFFVSAISELLESTLESSNALEAEKYMEIPSKRQANLFDQNVKNATRCKKMH